MRTKGGAIIIGIRHEWKENADNVIKALIDNGIKEGQTVAIELSPKDFQKDEKELRDGTYYYTMMEFSRKLAEIQGKIKSCVDKKQLKELRYSERIYSNIVGEVCFYYRLYGFLLSMGVKILPFSSSAKDERGRFMKAETRKRKRIRKFIKLPIREKHWRERLRGKNPRFVLAGAGHISAVKRMVPYEKVIDLDPSSFVRKAFYKARDALIRGQYRAIKEWKKAKRRLALPKLF